MGSPDREPAVQRQPAAVPTPGSAKPGPAVHSPAPADGVRRALGNAALAQQGGARVDGKPDPYRPLTDKIDDLQRGGGMLAETRLSVLRKLADLAKAVEANDLAGAKAAAAAFVALDDEHP